MTSTLKIDTIEPEGATTTLTVGESGQNTVIAGAGIKANLVRDLGGGATADLRATFTDTGTTSWTVPAGVTSVDYLVVAGGGGGGGRYGGGGGAGGFRTGTLSVTPSASLTVTVGTAGTGGVNTNVGTNGVDSVFSSITSTGGGGGGAESAGGGADGGSGGGGSYHPSYWPSGDGNTPSTSPVQGYDGSTVEDGGNYCGGGGGGASQAGIFVSAWIGGGGGTGRSSSMSGAAVTYAGGGGGGCNDTSDGGRGGYGGAGGGGAGGVAGNGVTATGFGSGGGGGGGAGRTGGNGTSGIVILKWNTGAAGITTLWESDGSGTLSNVNSGFGSAQTLISTTTVTTAVASISITTGIDSTYKEYLFEFINMNPETDQYFRFQVSTDGGSNYNTSVTSTSFEAYHTQSNSAAGLVYDTGRDQGNGTAYQALADHQQSAASSPVSGELHLFNPASTTYAKNWYCRSATGDSGVMATDYFYGGYFNTTSAINAINFKYDSDNIDAGTIKMYGIK